MSSPPMRSRHRICRRMPFILGSDSSYDHDPNRFFRACPTMSMRSPDSLHAYARDIVVWIRFPEERHDGKIVVDSGLRRHHSIPRGAAPVCPRYRVSAASWNRAVAALEHRLPRASEPDSSTLKLVRHWRFGLPRADCLWRCRRGKRCSSASERCRRFGFDIYITPHMLRHSFGGIC